MSLRSWSVLGGLAALALALVPPSTPVATASASPEVTLEALPSVEAQHGEGPAADPRAGERVPLVSPAPRSSGVEGVQRAKVSVRAGCGQAAAWSDVVHCRRMGGVRLLEFATPPPLR